MNIAQNRNIVSTKITKDIWLHECNRCKHKWTSKNKDPGTCASPKCRSLYWNKPRVMKKK